MAVKCRIEIIDVISQDRKRTRDCNNSRASRSRCTRSTRRIILRLASVTSNCFRIPWLPLTRTASTRSPRRPITRSLRCEYEQIGVVLSLKKYTNKKCINKNIIYIGLEQKFVAFFSSKISIFKKFLYFKKLVWHHLIEQNFSFQNLFYKLRYDDF